MAMSNNLRRLGNRITVQLKPDEEGYLGRECPEKTCLGYFKIVPGTGLPGSPPCHCPYCGHTGSSNTFHTPEQIEYVQSVALRQIDDAIFKDFKALEFDHKPRGGFGIGLSMKVTRSNPIQIKHYREKRLETHVTCERCTLKFAIYGVFGWCPDCGNHNSLQMLTKNLELANKQLALAGTVDAELAEHLIGDALENVVAAFDGFGREVCARRSADIRFQNLPGARRRVQDVFGVDFADTLDPSSWGAVCRIFQKRHLLAHKMGVIDAEYVEKAGDPTAVAGRRVVITSREVAEAAALVERLADRLFGSVFGQAEPAKS
jgi:hypothetical protein